MEAHDFLSVASFVKGPIAPSKYSSDRFAKSSNHLVIMIFMPQDISLVIMSSCYCRYSQI